MICGARCDADMFELAGILALVLFLFFFFFLISKLVEADNSCDGWFCLCGDLNQVESFFFGEGECVTRWHDVEIFSRFV